MINHLGVHNIRENLLRANNYPRKICLKFLKNFLTIYFNLLIYQNNFIQWYFCKLLFIKTTFLPEYLTLDLYSLYIFFNICKEACGKVYNNYDQIVTCLWTESLGIQLTNIFLKKLFGHLYRTINSSEASISNCAALLVLFSTKVIILNEQFIISSSTARLLNKQSSFLFTIEKFNDTQEQLKKNKSTKYVIKLTEIPSKKHAIIIAVSTQFFS
ncbi:hypothetical protein AGLY_016001 [Aphis glycines]|uniref:Uncharacterized protein n=1 Tax=Aphis glycines TaxID=307491 RepID=A0A6G0SYP3_APHGL|nr:hypothetical protein AGLY_016001 [Aphis glycines]